LVYVRPHTALEWWLNFLRFDFLTEININIEDLHLLGCDAMLTGKSYQCVGNCLPSATGNIPEDLNLEQHCCEKLKSSRKQVTVIWTVAAFSIVHI
jgi:hypothetical protein